MGRVWSVDAVAKNKSTSFYGNIVSLAESPLQEGLIWVGTDDGLIQLTRDGGATGPGSRRSQGARAASYVSDLEPSPFDAARRLRLLRQPQAGRPQALRLTQPRLRPQPGPTITGDLPARGTVYTLRQDHVDRDLLFVGTEFGVFFTRRRRRPVARSSRAACRSSLPRPGDPAARERPGAWPPSAAASTSWTTTPRCATCRRRTWRSRPPCSRSGTP